MAFIRQKLYVGDADNCSALLRCSSLFCRGFSTSQSFFLCLAPCFHLSFPASGFSEGLEFLEVDDLDGSSAACVFGTCSFVVLGFSRFHINA